MGGGGNVFEGANLPGPPVSMRFGWSQTQALNEAIFTRANDHPIDGAAVGMSDGLAFPPFPPALNTDRTLYLHLWLEGSPNVVSLAQAQGGLRLDLFGSHGALTVGGVAGTLYVSNRRLPNPGVTNSISLVILGDAIASQPWVEEQIAVLEAQEPTSRITPANERTFNFTLDSGSFVATNINPGTTGIVAIYFRNLEWDHVTQAVDRTFELTQINIIDRCGNDRSHHDAEYRAGGAKQPDRLSPIPTTGRRWKRAISSFRLRSLPAGFSRLVAAPVAADSILTGTLVVRDV